MGEQTEKVWVITRGEYSDYGIDAVLIGPADAQMHLLKAAHEVAGQTTTYRNLGYVAVQRTRHYGGKGLHDGEAFFRICPAGEVGIYAPGMTDEVVDDPRLDGVVDDYEWRHSFHIWLVQTQGFRDAKHEEFHIDGY